MPTPDETRELAADAVYEAIEGLERRGVDPDGCPRLLEALRHGTEQVIAAVEHGRDVAPYRRYLDEVYRRLDADPVIDDARIEPPRSLLAMRW
jgi:hypothetical protein